LLRPHKDKRSLPSRLSTNITQMLLNLVHKNMLNPQNSNKMLMHGIKNTCYFNTGCIAVQKKSIYDKTYVANILNI